MERANKNKVKFNLKNVHYSAITEGEAGAITYGEPKKWPGAVSISLDPEGETTTFHADGVAYYVTTSNNGYSGDFESAMVPDEFRTEILGETLDENGVLSENANVEAKAFALLFEFDGDVNEVKHVFYNCKCTRPAIASVTNEETKEVQTESTTITATPRADGVVKGKCSDSTAAAFTKWYTKVIEPDATLS